MIPARLLRTGAGRGHCTLHPNAPSLSCEPEPLDAALPHGKPVLAAMLDAYRRRVPGDPSITLRVGHLHLAAP
jgi:hypothetical protein